MRTLKLLVVSSILVVGLLIATFGFGITAAQTDSQTIRWDILNFTDAANTGGMAYAQANDGSTIMISGNGTFNTADMSAVTGGGTWTVFDLHGVPTGSGTFTVSELISWTLAPGSDPGGYVDNIDAELGTSFDDHVSGYVVLRVQFANEDGSDAEEGILVISCAQPEGTPSTIFEGVIASKGYESYWNRAPYLVGVNANVTNLYVLP